MIEQCDNCRFWKHEAVDYGTCRRYPHRTYKDDDDWCGEWTPDVETAIKRMGKETYEPRTR